MTLDKILLVFIGRTGRGAHHVAEVVRRQSGHDGVEVDHADTFAGGVIEQDVVELGVVVRDAFRQIRIQQNAGDGLMREGEFDLRLGQDGAAGHVRGDRPLQRLESFRRVVKIRNGVVQSRRGQAGQHLLESPERLAPPETPAPVVRQRRKCWRSQ